MNLRILKKLSKRAAPLLPLVGDTREQFRAEKDENYHGLRITARKNFERFASVHTDCSREDEFVIAPKCREGTKLPYVKVYPPYHPLEGTVMVGGMSGYYEPEWNEESAYGALLQTLIWTYFDYDPKTDEITATRSLRTPSEVFRAARDLIAANLVL